MTDPKGEGAEPREEQRYLSAHECRRPGDLVRLDPREYADLVARPATLLDLVRLRLELAEAIAKMVEAIDENFRNLAGR